LLDGISQNLIKRDSAEKELFRVNLSYEVQKELNLKGFLRGERIIPRACVREAFAVSCSDLSIKVDSRDERLLAEITDRLSRSWKLVFEWNRRPENLALAYHNCLVVLRLIELILKIERVED
jgi:hypothetical protein